MDWTWYLFGFKGRINRAKYWLAGLVIVSLMIAFAMLVYALLMLDFVAHAMGTPDGQGKVSFSIGLDDIFGLLDPATWRALSLAKLPMLLIRTAAAVFFLWIFLATSRSSGCMTATGAHGGCCHSLPSHPSTIISRTCFPVRGSR